MEALKQASAADDQLAGRSTATTGDRLTGLDGLRGVAALLVLGYHLWTEFGVFPVFARSYLAVDFFFALSGYVMARTYEERLRTRELTPASFLLLRYRRLWAPIAAGVLVGAVFHATAGQLAFFTLALNLLLLPNLSAGKPYDLNRPAWSIFFELAANVFHAFILSRVSSRALIALIASSLLVLTAFSLPFDAITLGVDSTNFFAGLPRVMVAYGIGVLLWRLRPRVAPHPSVAIAALAVLLMFIPSGLAWDIAFVTIATPAIIALGAHASGRAAAIAGALSFPLYAVHFPLIQICKALELGPLAAAAFALCAAGMVGLLIDRRLAQAAASKLGQRPI